MDDMGDVDRVIPIEGVIAQEDRAMIDAQVATAKRYPRSVTAFQSDLVTWAQSSEEIAIACQYQLRRGGKAIIGPSIRFAELMQTAYTNLATQGRIVDVGRETLIVEGTCRDLERNVGWRVEVSRRITNKEGRRYNDDMIQVTTNAAMSLAIRNAIIRTIPKALWVEIFDATRRVALGEAKSVTERRTKVLDFLFGAGAKQENILHLLEKPSVKDIDDADVLYLRQLAQEIHEGMRDVDETFPDPTPKPDPKTAKASASTAAADLAAAQAKLEQRRAEAKRAEPEQPEPEPEVDPETGEVIPDHVGRESTEQTQGRLV